MKVYCGVAVLLVCARAAHADAPLTIEDAVRGALARNERAAIADLDVAVSEANLAGARTALYPEVNASASNTIRPLGSPIDVVNGRLSVAQPFLVPAVYPRIARARHQLAGQRAESADERRRVAFDAARAFVAVLLAKQVVQASTRKLGTAKANLADTEAQVAAQLVSSNDVTRAKISLAGATRELAANQARFDAAAVQLAFVINGPVSSDLVPPAALLEQGQRGLGAIDAMISTSLSHRPDLVARKQTTLAAREAAKEPRRQYLPALSIGAQLDATSNPGGSGRNVDGQLAVTASWLIYDGGERAATIRARDAQVAIADLAAAQLARSIEAEVRSAAVQLVGSQQALVAAAEARDAARKGADEAAILYRQKLTKAIELVDANDQRFVAEVNYATAEFDVTSAYLNLRLAMGLEPVEP
ncbi:MAG: TolC family protein [Deltaproteobacteria bacterium]|nr:TolC family protein [Deltaproteobacteria bacterium]MCW5805103.1 TolC family protein [Deltaproteobacteria bacterium]